MYILNENFGNNIGKHNVALSLPILYEMGYRFVKSDQIHTDPRKYGDGDGLIFDKYTSPFRMISTTRNYWYTKPSVYVEWKRIGDFKELVEDDDHTYHIASMPKCFKVDVGNFFRGSSFLESKPIYLNSWGDLEDFLKIINQREDNELAFIEFYKRFNPDKK